MTERELMILRGFRRDGEGATSLSAGEIGRRYLGLAGRKRPDRSALTSLESLDRKGYVGSFTSRFSNGARLWFVTEVGSIALDAVEEEAAAA